jgi:hypothetical protein
MDNLPKLLSATGRIKAIEEKIHNYLKSFLVGQHKHISANKYIYAKVNKGVSLNLTEK